MQCSPRLVEYPPGTTQSCCNVIDYVLCTLHPSDYFRTTNLCFLIASPLSP